MVKIYYDKDVDLEALKGKTIAIIGYGIQGHAQAKNMKDSGMDVIVGLRPDGSSWEKAKADGFEPMTIEEAAEKGDIIHILIPDEIQGRIYRKQIKEHISEGNALSFSHGFNIRFNQIVPPENVDVIMMAPKGPGGMVRREYLAGSGVPALIAVEQNYTGKAKEIALAMAKVCGGTRVGVIETTFTEETETDLFGEQVDLCGGSAALIKSAFETLVEAGYSKEMAYFECLHEMKLIVDIYYKAGIEGMWDGVSNTAEYGGRTRGPRIIDEGVKKRMKEVLTEIQNGEFAREWMLENKAGAPVLNSLRKEDAEHPIEEVGKRLRKMMKI
ncbi:ketol-acid reductoisomerase [archaeon BMS3Bbin15]|nr:ketol-acid reductoisomerase [archaeon BMS3Bbin15]